jgi:hypothetical protein
MTKIRKAALVAATIFPTIEDHQPTERIPPKPEDHHVQLSPRLENRRPTAHFFPALSWSATFPRADVRQL